MKGQVPNSTFNTFIDAILSVFIILMNDGWTTIFFDHARVFKAEDKGIGLPTTFFTVLIIVGRNILFQLFLAILLKEFDERSMIEEAKKLKEKEENPESKSLRERVWDKLKAPLCNCC